MNVRNSLVFNGSFITVLEATDCAFVSSDYSDVPVVYKQRPAR